MKSIECRCCLAGQKLPIFEDCILQLEWVGSNSVTVDTASLSVLSLDKKLTMVHPQKKKLLFIYYRISCKLTSFHIFSSYSVSSL